MSGYLGSFIIDDTCTFYANAHTPATGAAVDADAAPGYRVYEDETGTPILTGSMALLDDANTVGFYSEQITLSAANGFEAGKSYCVRITIVVGTVTGVQLQTLQIGARVDTRMLGGGIQSATDLKDFADDGYDPATNKVQGVVLTDTVTTYTGNTLQTGDSFARLGAPAGASVSADIAAIEAQTDDIGIAGAGLTAVPWNAAWDAEVQSEVEDGLVAHRLDELLNADSDIDGLAPPTVGSVVHELMSKTAGSFTFDQTTDSLEAIRDKETDIEADTNELQTDWANGGRLDLILDARASQASVDTVDDLLDTEVAAIKAKTDSLTFTVANQVDANTLAISGDTTAADRLEALMDGLIVAQVNDAGATTTVFIADGFTEATNDHFNGRLITFLTGVLAAQQTMITDYVGATQTITVEALTEAPGNNDFFVIH